ncbi:MAG TPA: aspartate kinase [Sedimentisphaerales bacterium]|nr:aspartate kinase [Sedimentisphaerales bacterium]HRS12038.1 aspartate kinase [Sedimentisphaerales bacterium]HRV48529.1 aspartate kinase [Sedimentisphaerales bacterium]
MKVAKFGGTSVADAQQIRKVVEIVKADPDRRIVVVSAPGKRFSKDTKVTDLLIALADAVIAGRAWDKELDAVVGRYAEIQRDLGLDASIIGEIEADLRGRIARRSANNAQFMDTLKAAGEDNNAKIVAQVFINQGIPARYVDPREAGMLLSDDFGNAQVLPESFTNLRSLRDAREIIIFPGFFGYTRQGEVATFPRGGSDITGAILAAAVEADVYENFTDVDSVFALDPRIVPDAPAINLLTFREMRELSYAGFGVFHDEAIVPAVRAKVPICIKNTNRPEAPGTMIVAERKYEQGEITGIASADGFSAIYIHKYMMNRELGFGRRLLQVLEDERLSFEHVPSGIDDMSVILRSAPLTPEKEEQVLTRIRTELQVDDVTIEHGLSLVMIVGEGMRYAVGVAARACAALADAGVNIEMINQGSSEISIMFGVKEIDRKHAVQALGHALLKIGKTH